MHAWLDITFEKVHDKLADPVKKTPLPYLYPYPIVYSSILIFFHPFLKTCVYY